MLRAKNAAARGAHASLDQVHSAVALVAVSVDLRGAEDLECRHGYKMRVARVIAKTAVTFRVDGR